MAELSGDHIARARGTLLRDEFNRSLVNLVGRQLTDAEVQRTEEFLAAFNMAANVQSGESQ